MARALVTGGAGFIGSHIVDMLIQRGDDVLVVDDLSSGSQSNVNPKAKLEVMDICSPHLSALLQSFKAEVVVHTAAQISVRVSMEDPAKDTRINVVGLTSLLQALKGIKLPYFVFLSTGGAIYGEQERFPADEAHPIRPTSVYGLAKRVGELYLELWHRQYGMDFVALRLGNVYGPRQNPHGEAGVVAIFCKAILEGKIPIINGSGEQTRDYLFVGDVANAAKIALEKRVIGAFNIGTAKETSVNELYRLISAALGSKAEPSHGAAKAGEQLRSCIDSSKAKREFGWSPRYEISQGVKLTANWFKEQAGR